MKPKWTKQLTQQGLWLEFAGKICPITYYNAMYNENLFLIVIWSNQVLSILPGILIKAVMSCWANVSFNYSTLIQNQPKFHINCKSSLWLFSTKGDSFDRMRRNENDELFNEIWNKNPVSQHLIILCINQYHVFQWIWTVSYLFFEPRGSSACL